MKTKLIQIPGRVLTAPKVKYAAKEEPLVREGSWNMQGIKVNTGTKLLNWSYLIIGMKGNPVEFNRESFDNIIRKFHSALKLVGIDASAPTPGSEINVDGPDYLEIENAFKKAPRLILVILPSANTLLYNRVKQLGDLKFGVHTVCVTGETFAKAQPQTFANIALKFNLKLGGTNQLVDNPGLAKIGEDKTMIVGIDVTHPSPGSTSNAPSVAGMVASVDSKLGQWPADLRIQEDPRQEMVSQLDSMLDTRLLLWKTKGGHTAFPENILIYRDGVSEGQYAAVLDEELPLLRKACAKRYPPADQKRNLPKITIIIVGKRHHTRFYPTDAEQAHARTSNPKNGTVVDRGITEARNWDFFLQSHTALHGTARPAHYYVILNEIFNESAEMYTTHNTADDLENLTHSMCYVFGRATKAVSICPPAYYADIVCERARCYLSRYFDMHTPSATPSQSDAGEGNPPEPSAEDIKVHENLRNTMFYI